jgi:hypothetical protein
MSALALTTLVKTVIFANTICCLSFDRDFKAFYCGGLDFEAILYAKSQRFRLLVGVRKLSRWRKLKI